MTNTALHKTLIYATKSLQSLKVCMYHLP